MPPRKAPVSRQAGSDPSLYAPPRPRRPRHPPVPLPRAATSVGPPTHTLRKQFAWIVQTRKRAARPEQQGRGINSGAGITSHCLLVPAGPSRSRSPSLPQERPPRPTAHGGVYDCHK